MISQLLLCGLVLVYGGTSRRCLMAALAWQAISASRGSRTWDFIPYIKLLLLLVGRSL